MPDQLQRRLGVLDATTVGLGAMLGAGVFAAFAPAARASGSALLVALAVAGLIAYCNATSSARLAAQHPQAGGTYVYGRERLGPFFGHLAGWSFVVGKTASCAAMALTFGAYAVPAAPRIGAALAVVALSALAVAGVQKSTWLTRLILVVVLAVLTAVVVVGAIGATDIAHRLDPWQDADVHGVLQAAGFLFFAFAGYARVATLGEEVRDPVRTIPRAIGVALAIALAGYAAVAVTALAAVGAPALAASSTPLRMVVTASGASWLSPAVGLAAAAGALGALLALLLGVSRTSLAMARHGHLPRMLARLTERNAVPRNAELAVGAVVLVLVLTIDVRSAIAFSSFGVLLYYAIANVAAMRLRAGERPPPRWLPVVGVAGCVLLAVNLPAAAAIPGAGVVVLGTIGYAITSRRPLSAGAGRR